MWWYAISRFIDVDNATVRYAGCWQYMPTNQSPYNNLEKIWNWIRSYTLEDARRVSILILPLEYMSFLSS